MAAPTQDLRFALRTFLKQPGFTAVALLTIALGVGANTALFGIVNAVLLRPLPYSQPERVVMLWSHWVNWKKTWVSEPELADYRRLPRSLEHVGGFQYDSFNLTTGSEPLRVRAAQVQADVFAALGAQPILGRVFTADEDQPGHDHVVLLGEGLWRTEFGADRQVVGRTISLDATPYTVLGVLPQALRLPIDYATRNVPQVWVPLALRPAAPEDRGNHGLFALGRLRAGFSIPQAQAEMDAITKGFFTAYPGTYDPEFGVTLVSAPDEVFGSIRPALIVLLAAVGAVLLIACANVANLLLARAETRQKELAIRTVLGAGRSRIVTQMLIEALVLSLGGSALGVALARGLTAVLVTLDPLKIPRVQDVVLDGRVLAFTAAAAIATGLLFGIMPALHASHSDPQPALKEGGRESRVGSTVLRRTLVVSEIAASVVLVVAAMLLARSFTRLMNVDAGFNPAHVLTFRTSLPSTRYADAPAMKRAYRDVGRELRELPGVAAAGGVSGLPLASERGDWSIRIEGRPVERRLSLAADWQVVTPGYFEAMEIAVKEGRTFTDADRADSLPVIVINETMARTFWPGENALGRRLTMGGNGNWITIVGIVADVHHRGLDARPRTEMFRPHAQFPFTQPAITWTVRARSGSPLALSGAVRAAIHRVDPDLGVSEVMTMEQVLADSTSDRQLNMMVFLMLGGLALTLAAIGVYGVVAYGVSQRTHEIGVRMAIGAQPADVRRLILGQGWRLALVGVALGSALALAGARVIRGLLFQVSDTDPAIFVSVAAALVGVVMLATYLPARRAMRVDPMIAIRGE